MNSSISSSVRALYRTVPRTRFGLNVRGPLLALLMAGQVISLSALSGCSGKKKSATEDNDKQPAPAAGQSAAKTGAQKTGEPAAPRPADEPDPANWNVSMYQETHDFPAGSAFYLENLFGDIRLRPADDGTTVITGALQGEIDDKIKPVIEMSEKAGRAEIRVRFPDPDGGPDLTPKQTGKRRVDLAIFLGDSSAVEVKTRHGLLEAKKLPGPLTVESESAKMRLVVKNTLTARCSYGPVEVYFTSAKKYKPPTVTTVTGEIRVQFPEFVDASVAVKTSGGVTSDYSTEVKKESGGQHKEVAIQLGKGGPEVRLSSNSGNISVLEQPSLRNLQARTGPEQPTGKKHETDK